MASVDQPRSGLPPSMGPGARPLQPGERPDSLLREITETRQHYNIHIASNAIDLAYELKGQQRHYSLPFDNIPIRGLSRSLAWGGPNTAQVSGIMLIDLIRGCENVSGRRVTQEEAEGIAFYSTRRMMTMYVGQAVALGAGVGSAWVGRKDMKFPFMKPKDPIRYESFPMRAFPILRGPWARTMWHITRANIYMVMWLFLLNPLFRSVADTRMTVGLYADPRTHEIATLVKDKFDRLRMNRAASGAGRIQAPTPSTHSSDDTSPQTLDDTQGSYGQSGYAGDDTFTDQNTDTGLISDVAMQQRQTQDTSPNSWSRAQSRGSRPSMPQQQQPQNTSQSPDFFFDDASPTAGNDPDMGTPQTYNRQKSQPGAWARIRRGESGQSASRSSQSNQSPDFETRGDSFSFSTSEEERRLAKEQAQKEFDSLLERERREGGNADYIRDMRATEAGEESNSSTENAWARRRRG